MENSNQSAKFRKQRKFLLVLPLLTLPFITLMFWALGGGKGNAAAASNNSPGINLKLPDAKLKDDKQLDKLSFYHQAALDSAKAKAAEKLDPYWNRFTPDSNESVNNNYAFGVNENKTKVYNKLDELKKILDHSEAKTSYPQESKEKGYHANTYSSNKEIEQLQDAMQQMQDTPAEDPEITQLNESWIRFRLFKTRAKTIIPQMKRLVKPFQ